MNRKILIVLTVPIIVVMICFGLVFASTNWISVNTRLSGLVLEDSDDWMRIYIYVTNPTWQRVEIISVDTDWYVNGKYYKTLSTWYPPEWIFTEGEWDATVLPFEKSVVLWFRWTYAPYPPFNEPSGLNSLRFTIRATVDGQDIQLKTQVSFRTL